VWWLLSSYSIIASTGEYEEEEFFYQEEEENFDHCTHQGKLMKQAKPLPSLLMLVPNLALSNFNYL
jgi:hypothetical protein